MRRFHDNYRSIFIFVISEYASIFTSSRRFELLKEWLLFMKRQRGIISKGVYLGIISKTACTNDYKDKSNYIRRLFFCVRKPAQLFVFIWGTLNVFTFINGLIRLYKKIKRPIYIFFYATEYIPWLYVLPTFISIKFIRKLLPIKAILIHDYVDLYLFVYRYNKIEHFVHKIIEVLSLKISNIFISSSILISKYLEHRGVETSKIIYFPPLASRKFYEAKALVRKKPRDKIILVYTGNILRDLSSIDLLIETLSELDEKEKSKIRLNLILSISKEHISELSRVQNLLKKYGIETLVQIYINRPLEYVAEVVSRSDVGLAILDPNSYITRQFDFPLKVSEYLCAGIPVVYTNFGNINMFLKNKVHGWQIKHNKDDIKKLLKYLISNRSEIEIMKQRIEKIGIKFCLHNYAPKLILKIFKRVSL